MYTQYASPVGAYWMACLGRMPCLFSWLHRGDRPVLFATGRSNSGVLQATHPTKNEYNDHDLLAGHAKGPRRRLASCMSLGMMVTRLPWIAAMLESSK
mmetsp:Transcript_78582/g.173430  ORF Transcript_78582/g.173430 Transcript_78582/m.173430 type:complete len:98 (+) Transcript_78582:124-417(+)